MNTYFMSDTAVNSKDRKEKKRAAFPLTHLRLQVRKSHVFHGSCTARTVRMFRVVLMSIISMILNAPQDKMAAFPLSEVLHQFKCEVLHQFKCLRVARGIHICARSLPHYA